MVFYSNPIDQELIIQNNLLNLRQRKCDTHKKYQASHFCTNSLCVKNSESFLCELCYENHAKNHQIQKEIKTVDELFSTKRLAQIKENCNVDPVYQYKIDQVLQDIDQKFGKLKGTISKIIDDECNKVKKELKEKFSLDIDNERIMKIVKEHEQVILDLFIKDKIMINFESAINPYLKNFAKISEAFRTQIEIIENSDKNITLLRKNFAKINENFIDFVQQKISNFDELYNIAKKIPRLNIGTYKIEHKLFLMCFCAINIVIFIVVIYSKFCNLFKFLLTILF